MLLLSPYDYILPTHFYKRVNRFLTKFLIRWPRNPERVGFPRRPCRGGGVGRDWHGGGAAALGGLAPSGGSRGLARSGETAALGGLDPSGGSQDVGRILRTFKIKKNVEVTDNGKIII